MFPCVILRARSAWFWVKPKERRPEMPLSSLILIRFSSFSFISCVNTHSQRSCIRIPHWGSHSWSWGTKPWVLMRLLCPKRQTTPRNFIPSWRSYSDVLSLLQVDTQVACDAVLLLSSLVLMIPYPQHGWRLAYLQFRNPTHSSQWPSPASLQLHENTSISPLQCFL